MTWSVSGTSSNSHPVAVRRGCTNIPRAAGGAQEGGTILSSNSPVGQRMAASFGVEFPDSIVDGLIEVFRSRGGLVSEVMPLQVAPDRFDVVQLRGVFRQPLEREPVGALGERCAGRLAGVDRAVIQDEHDRLDRDPELGTIAPINLLQESKEV